MLPMALQNIVIANPNGQWIVSIGTTDYPFGLDETRARAFVALAMASINAAGEWYGSARSLLRQIESLLAEASRLRMIYEDNNLLTLILAILINFSRLPPSATRRLVSRYQFVDLLSESGINDHRGDQSPPG